MLIPSGYLVEQAEAGGDLEEGCKQLQGFYYQIVLREIETLGGDPTRLHTWARIAKEVAEEQA